MSTTVEVGIKLHNKFHLEVTDSVTGELVQEGFAENVVLNAGLKHLIGWFNHRGYYDYSDNLGSRLNIALGSGSTTPTVNDTALETPIIDFYPTNVSLTVSDESTKITSVKRIVLVAGQRTGDEYREIGLSRNDTTKLYTRALIVDGNGDPLTIVKQDLQILTITATIYAIQSHPYGSNLKFCNNTGNGFLQRLFAYDGDGSSYGLRDITFSVGSNSQAPSYTDSSTTLTNINTVGMNVTADPDNLQVTFGARIPASVTGTVAEMGVGITVAGGFYNSTALPWFRLVLPIGDNSPSYDNVYSGSSINMDGSHVLDFAFVLQFGSLV